MVDNWEYFYQGFGPQKYVAMGNENLLFDVEGKNKPFYRLNTLRVYENNSATFTIEAVNTTVYDWAQVNYVKYLCDMSNSNHIRFRQRSTENTRLTSMEQIMSALSDGYNVRYVSEYAKCYINGELGMGATGINYDLL
jgi:hypothetical protein